MTDREAQIEALWTYEISKEKVLKRIVKKGLMTQAEADELSERVFEQLDTDKIPGFRLSSLEEKMRTNGSCLNLYISITEIAKAKKISSPSYLIQSWMRSNTTIQYLRMWEKIHNPKFQEDACDKLIHTVHSTSTTLTPSLWISTTHAMGMKTSRGKGGGTTAQPEIAVMFRAWLFPEFMLELVQWYRSFYHGNNNDIVGSQ